MFALLKSMSIQLDIPEFPVTPPLPLDRRVVQMEKVGLPICSFQIMPMSWHEQRRSAVDVGLPTIV